MEKKGVTLKEGGKKKVSKEHTTNETKVFTTV